MRSFDGAARISLRAFPRAAESRELADGPRNTFCRQRFVGNTTSQYVSAVRVVLSRLHGKKARICMNFLVQLSVLYMEPLHGVTLEHTPVVYRGAAALPVSRVLNRDASSYARA